MVGTACPEHREPSMKPWLCTSGEKTATQQIDNEFEILPTHIAHIVKPHEPTRRPKLAKEL